jgi:hypothetical protein
MFSTNFRTTQPLQNTQTQQTSKQQAQQSTQVTGLQQDVVQIQSTSTRQVAQKTRQILEQAKQDGTPETELLGINKALKVMQQQVSKEQDLATRTQKATQLKAMMKKNAEIREALDDPKPSKTPNYPRPVSEVEDRLMDNLFFDLGHPDQDLAKKAHERLKKLGVSEEQLAKITNLLKAQKAHPSPRFGGNQNLSQDAQTYLNGGCILNPTEVLEEINKAKHQIVFGNSAETIIKAGVDQQLETVQHSVDPILFGSSGIFQPPNGGAPVTLDVADAPSTWTPIGSYW